MTTVIGRLPTGTEVLDTAFFGGLFVVATSTGVFYSDGSENSLKRLEPIEPTIPERMEAVI